jgi:hypothetical protein
VGITVAIWWVGNWELGGNFCKDKVGGQVGIVWELLCVYGGWTSGNCVGIALSIWWVGTWELCGNYCEYMVDGQLGIVWELL